jgi:hypothetical protein
MNKWVDVGITALTAFIITAGGAYTTIVTGTTASPDTAQIVTCIVAGVMAAALVVQKHLAPPPQ